MAIEEITVDELAALLPGARLIDVRQPDEYEQAHVPEAVLVPLAEVPDRLELFRGEGPAYVICKSGARSMRACEYLATEGIEAINIAGGTMAWLASGRQAAAGTT